MSIATVFEWLHGADFYRKLHREAASLLPSSKGMTWLDIGCGPGVLSREAALLNFHVRAIDRQPEMIDAAIRQSNNVDGTIEFADSDLDAEVARGKSYDVVSASSLLTALPNPGEGLAKLTKLAKPNGVILIIEASKMMTLTNAIRMVVTRNLGKKSSMLLLWAMARWGRTPISISPHGLGFNSTVTHLLEGMVDAFVLRRSKSAP